MTSSAATITALELENQLSEYAERNGLCVAELARARMLMAYPILQNASVDDIVRVRYLLFKEMVSLTILTILDCSL
jgi:hypothetical protein